MQTPLSCSRRPRRGHSPRTSPRFCPAISDWSPIGSRCFRSGLRVFVGGPGGACLLDRCLSEKRKPASVDRLIPLEALPDFAPRSQANLVVALQIRHRLSPIALGFDRLGKRILEKIGCQVKLGPERPPFLVRKNYRPEWQTAVPAAITTCTIPRIKNRSSLSFQLVSKATQIEATRSFRR